LDENTFDLVVLDLTIPSASGQLDEAPAQGQAVFYKVREVAPGTPVFFLTGSEPDAFSRQLARYGENIDLWGGGSQCETVSYFIKEETSEIVERIKALAAELAETTRIIIDTRGRDLGLDERDQRLLQIFTRLARGVACTVAPLGGGLSDARVFKVTAKNAGDATLVVCAAKLGSKDQISEEYRAYDTHVKNLTIGLFPPVYCMIQSGVGGAGGLFYTLSEESESLFARIVADKSTIRALIAEIQAGLLRWTNAGSVSEMGVQDIRRQYIDDEAFDTIKQKHGAEHFDEIEGSTVRIRQSVVHGDLHGGNILVDPRGRPVLIDFGDVAEGFAAIDPVTLELSMLFHPDGIKARLSKPLADRIDQWPHIDNYVEENDLKDVIQATRSWAHDVAGGDRAVLVAGYVFAARQLKYDTVEPEVALRLIASIRAKLFPVR